MFQTEGEGEETEGEREDFEELIRHLFIKDPVELIQPPNRCIHHGLD